MNDENRGAAADAVITEGRRALVAGFEVHEGERVEPGRLVSIVARVAGRGAAVRR